MNRRMILKAAAVGGAAVAAPSVARASPSIRWRLASSFPKSLDTIYLAAEVLAKAVAEVTDNNFQIQTFAAGEIVGGLQVLDATQNATVEMSHTYAGYFVGKDPTYSFLSGLPFGLSTRQQNSFMYYGPGQKLAEEFLRSQGVVGLPGGNTGVQMAGWFRKEVRSVEDLKGLKMRIGGLGGRVLAKVGVVPQQIAAGDIYPALERGTIDAVEWIGPYDDERLGFQKVTKTYMFPGWYDGGPMIHFFMNQAKHDELPPAYKAALKLAAHRANEWMVAKYDTENPAALRRLLGAGVELKPFPRDALDACFDASVALCEELAATNANFKKFYDPWREYRNDTALWFRVAELALDGYTFAKHAGRRA